MNQSQLLAQVHECLIQLTCRHLTGKERRLMEAAVQDFVNREVSRWSHAEILDRFVNARESLEQLALFLNRHAPQTLCTIPLPFGRLFADCKKPVIPPA